ncbi:LysM domain receptor-like kinase 4 [Senna tora]|uniref:LysM domain receptor-like kinase 4 n=1 Tax=Senna tora TaxID=362788 RepID=A0A834TX17_9FABA|nr:LysM domain receptor-like kinase 4 [Senna tora]
MSEMNRMVGEGNAEMDYQVTGFREAVASFAYAFEAATSTSSAARASFQWGGTIFVLILLILNRFGRDSRSESTLLVLYLFTSFPEVLFKILRGQFGCWVAFLAVVANLFFPETFPVPVSRFLLFVIAPNWIAHGLRDSLVGGVFCLVIGILLVITEIRGNGGFGNCRPVEKGLGNNVKGQQPYIGRGTTACPRKGNSKSIRGYTCNGVSHSCQTYLTFRSQPLYNSVSTISALLSSDPSLLSQINSVSLNATFQTNQMVIVPVNCSCAGDYYQSNTSYTTHNTDTYFLVANNTFQGLSTCQALMDQNHISGDILSGTQFTVPLRCACPTKNQTQKGVKYLLSYLIDWGDSVSLISKKFGVLTNSTLEANSLSYEESTIFPFTTLLVPLLHKPNVSQVSVPPSSSSSLPPSSPPSSSSGGSSKKTWVYAVVGAVGGVVLILVLVVFFFRTRYPKSKKKDDSVISSKSFEAIEKPEGNKMEQGCETLSEIISGIAQSFKVYGFKELQSATDNFSSRCWIKGSVYRGVINGDLAAIKRKDGDVSKEIEILNKVNHSNVIRLSGVSFNEGHWYLVYEYAANGPLSDWIFFNNNVDGKFLTWAQRIQIALDVATGLDYLHSFTSPPHIHKDLKSENILLDNDFRAKITNLGLARSVKTEDDQFPMTRHIVGIRGYMAPEYLENGIISTKLDVYAFGVLMLEILSGKEVAAIVEGDKTNLSDVLSSGEEKVGDFMDPSLKGNYPLQLAVFVVRMIDNCIKTDPASRPAMHEIVQSLSVTLNSSLTSEMSVNVSGYQSLSRSS